MSDEKAFERALALLHTLHSRTREGKVNWQETDDTRTFQTESGDFDLRIRLLPDRDYPDQPDYALEVFRRDSGRKIDTISNVTLRPVMDQKTPDGLNPYAVLEQLYEMARRKALRVDDVLDSILQTLEESD